jgi:hypothetical protein
MEKAIWASAYASSKGAAATRAGIADRTVRSLQKLESRREGESGPEYEVARSAVMLEMPEFESWYRVQMKIAKHPWARKLSEDECSQAYERYRRGLGDFY